MREAKEKSNPQTHLEKSFRIKYFDPLFCPDRIRSTATDKQTQHKPKQPNPPRIGREDEYYIIVTILGLIIEHQLGRQGNDGGAAPTPRPVLETPL